MTNKPNITRVFMESCLKACDENKNLLTALVETCKICECEIEDILERPKTPLLYLKDKSGETICKMLKTKIQAYTWLAINFHPVYMAWCDNKPKSELIKLWINTDRDIKINNTRFNLGCELLKYKRENKSRRFISQKASSWRHDWKFIK